MVKPEKVATPLTVLAVSVPPKPAPPGLLARASVTLPVNVGSMLPHTSSAATSTRSCAGRDRARRLAYHRQLGGRHGGHLKGVGLIGFMPALATESA